MRSAKIVQMDKQVHETVLHGMLHAFRKTSDSAEKQDSRADMVVIGMSENSTKSIVRDILRSATVPSNVRCMGVDMIYSGARRQGEGFGNAMVFILQDVAMVMPMYGRDLISIFRQLESGAGFTDCTYYLTTEIASEFIQARFRVYAEGAMQNHLIPTYSPDDYGFETMWEIPVTRAINCLEKNQLGDNDLRESTVEIDEDSAPANSGKNDTPMSVYLNSDYRYLSAVGITAFLNLLNNSFSDVHIYIHLDAFRQLYVEQQSPLVPSQLYLPDIKPDTKSKKK